MKLATFAGGCFWCMEPPFVKLPGVESVTPGYTGGPEPEPTYQDVASGATGHLEAVQVRFDPDRVGYAELLEVFWRQIDPTDAGGQFVDRGRQYRTAIFHHDEEQRRLALESRAALEKSGRFDRPIVTEILPAEPFHPAEEYHQGYHRANPRRYRSYRWGSGRDQFLEGVWDRERDPKPPGTGSWHDFAKPPCAKLQKSLTPLQFEVTQEGGTEPPFRNPYWDEHREGIFVDVVSGEPLFSSRDKFDSGTGWPSFSRPLEPGLVKDREDDTHGMSRTEVRSRHGDSHLGHVFPDGPGPGGRRYCINSAALRFVPREEMEQEGYGDYLLLFQA